MHRLGAIVLKEYYQIKRDKRTLFLLLFFPVLLLVIFGYAIDFDVKHVKLAVLDFDNSPGSRSFIRSFEMYDHFEILYHLNDYNEIDEYLDCGRATLCVVIPVDFSDKINSGEDVGVQVLLDGTNSNSGMTALGNLRAYISSYAQNLRIDAMKKAGFDMQPVPVVLESRVWYNQELKSEMFLIPGLIGFIMLIMCVVTTALSIVREKERNTIEQISVSPIRPFELIIGKTLPYMVISLIAMTFIIIMSMILFDLTIKGSLLYLLITSILFICGSLGVGMFVSTVTSSQQVAFMVSILATMVPAIILSGFVFPQLYCASEVLSDYPQEHHTQRQRPS